MRSSAGPFKNPRQSDQIASAPRKTATRSSSPAIEGRSTSTRLFTKGTISSGKILHGPTQWAR